ncbi:MAG TPA: ATP-binding cassette domain-containing protein [Candidatus Bathyarchaeia archaeon]|nr:ATP-binding cassette domain-containing protein [Candidatus Bathyarchaeia archaeon]
MENEAIIEVKNLTISENESMIQVKNLTKMFKNFTAVDSISFDVKKGEIFGLLGPNGAGKSTTIRMLCTLSRPTKGTATIGGYDIVKNDTEVRKLVGIVSEKMIMYDRLTAKENLRFFGSLFGLPKDVLDKRISELLDLVQLTKWKDSLVGTFSTGMRQRMNVIRALLNMPQVLFLDEPTLGLDPQSTVEIREFIRKVNRENKTTILVTTHMMGEADLLCDRIGIIDHGKIAALDTSANLKRMIQGANTTILTLEISNMTPDLVSMVRSLECVEAVSQENSSHLRIHAHGDDAFDTIVDAVRARKTKIDSIQNLQPTLEDVFLHVTGHEVRDNADRKIPMANHHHNAAKSRVR